MRFFRRTKQTILFTFQELVSRETAEEPPLPLPSVFLESSSFPESFGSSRAAQRIVAYSIVPVALGAKKQ